MSLTYWSVIHYAGNMAQRISVQSFDGDFSPLSWSANILPGDMHHQSVTIHLCCPATSAVGVYALLAHFESRQGRRTFKLGAFVLLCNPWLKGGSTESQSLLLSSALQWSDHWSPLTSVPLLFRGLCVHAQWWPKRRVCQEWLWDTLRGHQYEF